MYNDKKRFYQGHHATSRYRHSNDMLSFLTDPDILKESIRNHQFKVYLQPKINVSQETLCGAEALVRYQDKDGIIVSPDKFIPILENTYLISKIDFYVFEPVSYTHLDVYKRQIYKFCAQIISKEGSLVFAIKIRNIKY